MNPNASDAQNAPALNGENFSITRPNYDTGDITYSLEESTNMSNWTTTKTFNLTEPLTFTLPLSGRKFFRWRATYTP